MESSIYIPEKIKVGFSKREDTYSKKLGYVIYYDAKGKLRKETSWQSWREKNIDPEDYTNEPISGFVLNKKVGGTSWSHWDARQTYSRIYDPRGFEFEITIPNLLYILENTDCIRGKGLTGDFVYGWDGTELLLIPTSAPEYSTMKDYSKLLIDGKVLSKELVPGGTYLTNKNKTLIYMGRFESWTEYSSWRSYGESNQRPTGKKYFFYEQRAYGWGARPGETYNSLVLMPSISGRIIKCLSTIPVDNYAEMMDELESDSQYSPLDHSATVFNPVTEDDIKSMTMNPTYYFDFQGRRWTSYVHINEIDDEEYKSAKVRFDYVRDANYYYYHYSDPTYKELQLKGAAVRNRDDLFKLSQELGFTLRTRYLKNGKVTEE